MTNESNEHESSTDLAGRPEQVVMSEKFYDEEIAPQLLELCKKCQAKGVSFVAVVEYRPEELSSTYFINDSEGTAIRMVQHCAKMGRNIDGFVFGMIRWMREKKRDFSQSIVMTKLAS